jgi:rubrerythrin
VPNDFTHIGSDALGKELKKAGVIVPAPRNRPQAQQSAQPEPAGQQFNSKFMQQYENPPNGAQSRRQPTTKETDEAFFDNLRGGQEKPQPRGGSGWNDDMTTADTFGDVKKKPAPRRSAVGNNSNRGNNENVNNYQANNDSYGNDPGNGVKVPAKRRQASPRGQDWDDGSVPVAQPEPLISNNSGGRVPRRAVENRNGGSNSNSNVGVDDSGQDANSAAVSAPKSRLSLLKAKIGRPNGGLANGGNSPIDAQQQSFLLRSNSADSDLHESMNANHRGHQNQLSVPKSAYASIATQQRSSNYNNEVDGGLGNGRGIASGTESNSRTRPRFPSDQEEYGNYQDVNAPAPAQVRGGRRSQQSQPPSQQQEQQYRDVNTNHAYDVGNIVSSNSRMFPSQQQTQQSRQAQPPPKQSYHGTNEYAGDAFDEEADQNDMDNYNNANDQALEEGQEQMECPSCSRKFNAGPYQKHVKICAKVFIQKRKAFDSSKMRVAGDKELQEILQKKAREERTKRKKGLPVGEEKPLTGAGEVPKWKAESKAFREAMKQSRAISVAEATGAPMPVVVASQVDPSLVLCPHCNRRFNKKAADRHIPLCQNIIAKPSSLKAKTGGAGGINGSLVVKKGKK